MLKYRFSIEGWFSKSGLTRKILVGVLTGCLNYIVYYLIPLLAIRQIMIPQAVGSLTVLDMVSGIELFNVWILLGLILLSVATSILSGSIVGVVIGASIPVVMIVYLMSLFGVLTLEYLGYRIDVDVTYILILLSISVALWSIAKVFKYVESLQ